MFARVCGCLQDYRFWCFHCGLPTCHLAHSLEIGPDPPEMVQEKRDGGGLGQVKKGSLLRHSMLRNFTWRG